MQQNPHVRAWLRLSLWLHMLWFILFGLVLLFGPFDQLLPRPDWVQECMKCDHIADSIETASQMGRLDVVSISLTILGVVIAFSAFGSYGLIRSAAMDAAKREVNIWLDDNYRKFITKVTADEIMEDQRLAMTLATLVKKHISEASGDISSKDADDIAKSTGET